MFLKGSRGISLQNFLRLPLEFSPDFREFQVWGSKSSFRCVLKALRAFHAPCKLHKPLNFPGAKTSMTPLKILQSPFEFCWNAFEPPLRHFWYPLKLPETPLKHPWKPSESFWHSRKCPWAHLKPPCPRHLETTWNALDLFWNHHETYAIASFRPWLLLRKTPYIAILLLPA